MKYLITSLIALLMLGLFSCSEKYPEGPGLSIWSAKHRVEGQWKWTIARMTEKGVETNLSLLVANDTLSFLDDETVTDSRYGIAGTWALVSKNKELNIVFGSTADSLLIPPAISFQLKELREKSMWLEFADDSVTIEWQLEGL